MLVKCNCLPPPLSFFLPFFFTHFEVFLPICVAHEIDCLRTWHRRGINNNTNNINNNKKLKTCSAFGSHCILMRVKEGAGIRLKSNSAARRWRTSGCVKDAPGRNLSRLMEWGAQSRDSPRLKTQRGNILYVGEGGCDVRARKCVVRCKYYPTFNTNETFSLRKRKSSGFISQVA